MPTSRKRTAAAIWPTACMCSPATATAPDRRSALSRRHPNSAIWRPIAKSQLAAALALVGDRTRAERVYAAALESLNPKPVIEFGGSITLGVARCRRTGLAGKRRQCAARDPDHRVERVEAARGLTPYTLDPENAWLVLASRALAKETLLSTVDGSPVKTALYRSYKAAEMAASRSRSPIPATARCRR